MRSNRHKAIDHLEIYTDGSCIHDSESGAYAIVVVDATIKNSIQIYCKTKDAKNSTEMEYEAIKLALEYIAQSRRAAMIYSDNMACVRTVNAILSNSLDDKRVKTKLVMKIKNIIEKSLTRPVQCVWIKGHAGHKYNVIADQAAKTNARKEHAKKHKKRTKTPIKINTVQ